MLIEVERFWRPALINSVLPVVLVFCLAVFVFFTGREQLCSCSCPAAECLKLQLPPAAVTQQGRHKLT